MKKTVTYILLPSVLAALFLTGGCRRPSVPDDEPVPGDRISILPSTEDTKGFIGSSEINTDGMRVAVVDYLTDFQGTFDQQTGSLVYFDDVVQYGSNQWDFVSGSLWQWTRTGTHHFFGWLDRDSISGLTANAYGSGTNRVKFDRDTKAFTIPTISFTKNSPQFDLCYSNWVTVESATRTSSSVELPMNHAFMALAVYITNRSADRITLRNVQFNSEFHNTKSASFAYGASGISYDNQGSSEFLATSYTDPVLSQNKRIDLINGVQISSSERPANTILMWPQTAAEVDATQIHLEYTIDGIIDPANPSQLLVISRDLDLNLAGLKDTNGNTSPMRAGHKYFLEILFKDKEILLEIKQRPWVMDYSDTSYSESAIVAKSDAEMEGVLWLWNRNTTTNSWDAGSRSREITLTNGRVQGRFFIESPTEGEWQIDVYPASAAQYYVISPTSGLIEDLVDGDGRFTGKVVFEINPNPLETPPARQELHFNVNIRVGGQWRNANTEFNRKDWKLYLNP